MTTERKYALTKIAAGDYLLPSNDGQTIWRIRTYTDGPSFGIEDWISDRDLWAIWRWVGARTPYVDVDDWERWETVEEGHETRREAINRALVLGEATA